MRKANAFLSLSLSLTRKQIYLATSWCQVVDFFCLQVFIMNVQQRTNEQACAWMYVLLYECLFMCAKKAKKLQTHTQNVS